MTFPINITVPNINNDPADDVAPMNQNFININGFLSVDHVAPGSTGDGFHKQVTFNALTTPAAPPGNPSGPFGISYCKAGGLQPTVGQAYYINDKGSFPMSAIRVVGQFNTTLLPTMQTLTQSVNVTVLDHGSPANQGTYRFTVTSGTVSSTTPIVFVNALPTFPASPPTYSYSSGTLSIFPGGTSFNAQVVNFFILEI